VTHQKIQANSLEEAKALAREYSNYPGMKLIRVKEL
jgi:hypothetical protein